MNKILKLLIVALCASTIRCADDDNQNDNQSDQSEERFLAVHIDTRVDSAALLPEELVEPYLPSGFKYLQTLNATRTIVNGLRYDVTFTMMNELDSDATIEYCEIVIIEKPWLIKDSENFRKMTFTNCSLSINETEDTQYEINPIFMNQRTEVSRDEMFDLEDQIVTIAPREVSAVSSVVSSYHVDETTERQSSDASSFHPFSNINLGALEEIFGIQKSYENSGIPNEAQKTVSNETSLKEIETEIKKAFSELFQNDQEFQMNIIAIINRKDDESARVNYERIVKILAAKLKEKIENLTEMKNSEQIVINENPNSSDRAETESLDRLENVQIRPIDTYWIENPQMGTVATDSPIKQQIVGGVTSLDVKDEDVQLYLNEALTEINGEEDPDYSVVEVLSASTQVVAGVLVKFQVKLLSGENHVICDFEVWEQAWLADGRKVKANCDNEKKYSLTQTPVNKREKEESTESPGPGRHEEIDVNDEKVLNLLTVHLQRLDTGSEEKFELVSIEKVTKQVVAGLNYKVKGVFRVGSEESRNCAVDIWTRPWIQSVEEGTQIKAECEDGLRLKTKRTKRSLRPMPIRHDKFYSKDTSELKARNELKSEVLFENFVKKFKRRYSNDEEEMMRLRIFKKNLHKIEMLNSHEHGTAKYGITQFADLNEKEYFQKTGLVVRERSENDIGNPIATIPDIDVKDLPEEFDWTEKGAVTPVKNQGNCGSCWSFSVTGNIEGLHAIKTGSLESYSEQELLDCDQKDNACNGGYMDDAFKAIETIGGLELEEDYKYLAKKNKKCMFNSTKVHVKVAGLVDMPKGDEIAIQKYLVVNGPISIGINAAAMQFYRGGVSHPWKILCRKSDLDHGVLLVGYGVKSYPMFNKTLPYWKIKNSWGPKWGEQGFYRIYRGDNSCGVAEMASSAILA